MSIMKATMGSVERIAIFQEMFLKERFLEEKVLEERFLEICLKLMPGVLSILEDKNPTKYPI